MRMQRRAGSLEVTTPEIALQQRLGDHRPLWPELLAGLEWLSLKASPVYYGLGVPRGDDAPVVLVPGFLGSDRSLLEMHLWLGRIGYRSYLSGIGRNAGCPDTLMERLLETVEGAYVQTGRKVKLIGHSLGGLLARAAAVQRPEQIAQVITLASPFRQLSAHPLVLTLISVVRGKALEQHLSEGEESCECSFMEALSAPLPASVARTAIYTKSDPVVNWRDCMDDDERLNVEVHGTHIGLAHNRSVYREVARLLAHPIGAQRPQSVDAQPEPGQQRAA